MNSKEAVNMIAEAFSNSKSIRDKSPLQITETLGTDIGLSVSIRDGHP